MNINMMFVVFLIFTIPYIILSYDQNDDSTLTHQYTIYIDNNNNTIFSFVEIVNEDTLLNSFTKTFLENNTESDIEKELHGHIPYGLNQLILYLIQYVTIEQNKKLDKYKNVLQFVMSCKLGGGGYNNYLYNNDYFNIICHNRSSITCTKNMTIIKINNDLFMYSIRTFINDQCRYKLMDYLTNKKDIIEYKKKPTILIYKHIVNDTFVLTCYALGYFPKQIAIHWDKINIKNITDSVPYKNYNYESWSSISLDSSPIELKYTCHVYHNNYHFEVTAYIEKDINIIFLIIPILIIMLLLIAAIAYKFYPFSENIYKKMYK
ncbi:MHC class I-like protein [Deerpox virus W-848-83]|uniref:MHC class I-like protein n=1 Tax=Deerpox virus (strain Mule deer/United States/W-848-83/1983) TaxID=305674 RepID=Q08FK1_DPV83|nr:MHC class I -like protein [Deerpox virus W-848-83]ABI99306.1 MHC class I-like protein [Deerpox virus W-848-83]